MIDRPEQGPFLHRRGKGRDLFVFGGGPGLSHDYLAPALAPLEARWQLIYMDYPGCGGLRDRNGGVTAESTVSSTLAALDSLQSSEPINVLCHSFGAYVLAAVVLKSPRLKINKCVFICPSPHSRAQCRLAEEAFFARMTPEDRQFAYEVFVNAADRPDALMQRLLPYYCGRNTDLPRIDIDFNARTYVSVMNSLDEFDLNDVVRSLSCKLYVFGSADFIQPAFFSPDPASAIVTLPGGHFLFYDAQSALLEAVEAFLA
jgi:pimeloyl-ACP methyl ester carboxylesterase